MSGCPPRTGGPAGENRGLSGCSAVARGVLLSNRPLMLAAARYHDVMTSDLGERLSTGPVTDPALPMLRMRAVRKVYRSGLIETEALAGLSVTVARGEFLAIMGPSGSGKTTFLSVA